MTKAEQDKTEERLAVRLARETMDDYTMCWSLPMVRLADRVLEEAAQMAESYASIDKNGVARTIATRLRSQMSTAAPKKEDPDER